MKRTLIILALLQTLVAAYLGLFLLPRCEKHLSAQASSKGTKDYHVSQAIRFGSGPVVVNLTPGFIRGYLLAKEGIDVSIRTSYANGKWSLESNDPVPISVSDRNLSNASLSFLEAYHEQKEQD
jgi:hypothetical protein